MTVSELRHALDRFPPDAPVRGYLDEIIYGEALDPVWVDSHPSDGCVVLRLEKDDSEQGKDWAADYLPVVLKHAGDTPDLEQ